MHILNISIALYGRYASATIAPTNHHNFGARWYQYSAAIYPTVSIFARVYIYVQELFLNRFVFYRSRKSRLYKNVSTIGLRATHCIVIITY